MMLATGAHDGMHWSAAVPSQELSTETVTVWTDPAGEPLMVEAVGSELRTLEAEIASIFSNMHLELAGSPTLDVMNLDGWIWWNTWTPWPPDRRDPQAVLDESFAEALDRVRANAKRRQ